LRIFFVVVGAILLALGIMGLIAGILVYNLGQRGFKIDPERLETDARAIVLKDVDIGLGEDFEQYGLKIGPDDFAVLTLTGHSNDEDKEFFVGLAEEGEASDYLADVEYDEVIGSEWTQVSPFRTTYADFQYERFPGQGTPADPTQAGFWEIMEYGDGSRTLEWEVESGTYWIVLMNSDGSPNIDADAEMYISIPSLLNMIAYILLAGGAVFVSIGGILVYIGTRPPVPPVEGESMT
jgi:hypothetical protein